MDPVQAAIAQAQAAAAQTTSAPPMTNVPATMNTASGAAVVPGRRRTIDDLLANAGAACEFYFQASDKMGITFDKDDSTYFEDIEVEINLAEIASPYCLKYSSGGVVQYARSYDGVVDSRSGLPWAQVVAQARQVDQKCTGHYEAAEFVGTLLKDYTTRAGKTFPAGTRVGHTTATTGTKFFVQWLAGAIKAYGSDAVLKVRLVHKRQEKNTYKWGVLIPETIITN